ncbi:MAG: DUF4331 domain-containing protein [Chloroflexi bacterium]|nr:MAG: DUF4331 domain-containing protein [Chloroflexota bacterium]
MADHNDPNAVNTIFSDVEPSAADVYDLFGFPSPDVAGGEKVVVALTFASVPEAGTLDADLLYRIHFTAHPRVVAPTATEHSLETILAYIEAVRDRYLGELRSSEVRVNVDAGGQGTVQFIGFPGGDFTTTVPTNQVTAVDSSGGHRIQVFLGGRDDAFFNDLTGFFRSINYAPQFYHVPHDMVEARELPIPKTLIELEGNVLFNFDPANPELGHHGVKGTLPAGPWTWTGDRFKKDADGNYRFVYTGVDAQAGKNVNTVVLEIPLGFVTASPAEHRIVNTWAESWVRLGVGKVPGIHEHHPFWQEHPWALLHRLTLDGELRRYKLVDTVGQPFADAALSEREDSRQVGANNVALGPHFIKRLAHLGWGFGPSITALGLHTSFDHDNSPVSVHRTYELAVDAFPRVRRTITQQLRMPDESWNPRGLDIPLRRPYEIFIPNVCAIDMDTTGTWPFGRRLEDQVATRFLSMFLDHEATLNGRSYHVEMLSNQALWDAVPIVPRTPPNPLRNDRDFLDHFPYLAEPW